MHHLYYGLALVILSLTAVAFVEDVRTKWDGALFLGVGTGLAADEVGLLLLGVPYWSFRSMSLVLFFGAALGMTGVYQILSKGTSDFRILERSDVLTALSILLALTGFLYFDRPLRIYVEYGALFAWGLAAVLLLVHGRRHLLRIRKGHLSSSLK